MQRNGFLCERAYCAKLIYKLIVLFAQFWMGSSGQSLRWSCQILRHRPFSWHVQPSRCGKHWGAHGQSQSCDSSSPVLEAQELCSFQASILADMDDNMLTAHSSSTSDAPADGSCSTKAGERSIQTRCSLGLLALNRTLFQCHFFVCKTNCANCNQRYMLTAILRFRRAPIQKIVASNEGTKVRKPSSGQR